MQRYAITNGTADATNSQKLAQDCAEVAAKGVDFILVREKHLPAGVLADVVRTVLAAVDGRTRVLVAQRVDVAIAAGAAGVHLSGSPGELMPSQVRTLMPSAFVSVACHSVVDVVRAKDNGADAALFGPVFGKTVNGNQVVAGVGLEMLREACAAAGQMPVFALGGVTEVNAGSCVGAGASGVAAIRMFFPHA